MNSTNIQTYKNVNMTMNRNQTPLQQFVLPEEMNDGAIQSANNSLLMTESQFKAIRYALFDDDLPNDIVEFLCKLEKKEGVFYIFHVLLDSGTAAAQVVCIDKSKLREATYGFGDIKAWPKGSVFFYFTTK